VLGSRDDSSAVVKLVVREPGFVALRRTCDVAVLLFASALARADSERVLVPFGADVTARFLRGLSRTSTRDG
jgi:hypothetical protein